MPVVIAHRGASGYRPEHTLAAYALALEHGADALEPDLVMSRDGVFVARHENELGATTDVARHARFAARRVTKTIDGLPVTGWFTEDFTLEELKCLRVRERIAELRPQNSRFDGQFEIATLEEIFQLRERVMRERQARAARLALPAPAPIGVYAELKHPSHFAACGLAMAEPLVQTFEACDCLTPDSGVYVESFEADVLRALHALAPIPLVQLIDVEGSAAALTAAACTAPAGLAAIATYAACLGPEKSLVIPRDAAGRLRRPTPLVADCHAAGLRVMAWTFRAENAFLPAEARSAGPAHVRGDLTQEIHPYLTAGIDGFFTDQPDLGVRARDAFLGRATQAPESDS